jgi:anti-repressor protein
MSQKVELQEKEIKKQAPKVQDYNEVLQSDSTYTTTQIAKELEMGAPTLNRKLQSMGVQYKQSGQRLL